MPKLGRFLIPGLALFAIVALVSSVTVQPAQAQVRAAWVKSVDERGRTPYQVFIQTGSRAGGCAVSHCFISFPDVPVNKRLVITNLAATIYLDGAETTTIREFHVGVNDSATSTNVAEVGVDYNPNPYPIDHGSTPLTQRYVVNQQLLLYVEAGQRPHVEFFVTQGGQMADDWQNKFLLTGYMVDLAL